MEQIETLYQTPESYTFFREQGFLPVDGSLYGLFKRYERENTLQERSAVINISWSCTYRHLYKIICDYLCCAYFRPERPVYFVIYPPRMDKSAYPLQSIVDRLYELSKAAGQPFLQIRLIEERFLSGYEALSGYHITIEYQEDNSEYAFKTKDFINLSGTVNLNKRQRLTKLFKRTDLFFKPIANKNIDICLEIQKTWCRTKDCSYCMSFLGCEKEALTAMFALFNESVHRGILLYCNDIPVGYGIGERINERLAFAYFGKSIGKDYFLYILYTMTKLFFNRAEYINLDVDMGNHGLRMFKTHLGLYGLWRKYICTFTKD